tara:strand:- start:1813 stop:2229 length:417 start_codon:yes stop_codon:yes gene_type:complete
LKKKISDKDKLDWNKFISKNESVEDKDDIQTEKRNIFKERTVDLHGLTLEKANEYIKNFIIKSYKDKVNKINVITGKGKRSKNKYDPYISKDLSILKYSVPDYINRDKDLVSLIKNLSPARMEDGGEGAFYIYLRKKK